MRYIGTRIKLLMSLKNFTIAKLAKHAGLQSSQIANVIRGRSTKLMLLEKISSGLQVPLDYLVAEPKIDENIKIGKEETKLYQEYLFCMTLCCREYGVDLNQTAKSKIFRIIKNNKYQSHLKLENLTLMIYGIITLLKEDKALIEYISKQ